MALDPTRVETVFNEAVSNPKPSDRAAYLDRACGDDAQLRQRVEALLTAHDGAGSFLGLADTDSSRTLEAINPLREGPGTVIGRYKLLEQIGEGGFGVVFMAEQKDPVRRKVALKIIKLGMDTKQVTARFEAERQALAMMDHPHIAKVLDGGATETGRPFFVMELVRGVPITTFADESKLTTRERIELFVPVCSALQHAHQKGIIHRDLKPNNVLVTMHDDKPVPMIIDFGIAKATEGRLTEKTLFTEFRQLIGTPAYMSPEQAQLSGLDVDTRSDIYSLGVLLYELLTGTTPFDGKELRAAAYEEMRRIIREVEPPTPSTRLSTMAVASLSAAAGHRRCDPRSLSRTLKGDLDWIIMKCLEKDRSRRYETANGLACDIQRYLSNEPVEASPPSTAYKLRKLLRKHRVPLTVAAGFALILVAATVVSSWQAVRATRARNAEARQRTLAQGAAASEAAQRKQAEAVAGLLESVFRGLDPYAEKNGGADLKTQLVAQLDQTAASLDQDYSGQPLVRAKLRNALGLTQLHLGETSKAEMLFKTALDDQRLHAEADDPETLTTLDNLGIAYRVEGRYAAAVNLHEQVRDRRMKQLGPDHPDTLATLHNLARAYQSVGRIPEAIKVFEEARDRRTRTLGPDHPDTLSTLNYLANAYRSAGRNAEAMRLWEQVRDQRSRTLGPDHPDTLLTLTNIAIGYTIDERKYPEAIKLLERVRDEQIKKLGPGHPDSLIPLTNLANAYGDAGRYAEAIQLLEQVRDERTKNLGANHLDTLETRNNLGFWYAQAGRSGEAVKLLEEVRDQRMKQLGSDHPDTLRTLVSLASAYQGVHRYAESIQLDEQVRDQQMKRLGRDHPDTLSTLYHLATVYRGANRIDEAIKLHEQVRDRFLKTHGREDRGTLNCLNELAWDHVYAGRGKEAVKLWEQELDGEMKFGTAGPDTLRTMHNLANAYRGQGRIEDAIRLYEHMLDEQMKDTGPDDPQTLGTQTDLAAAYRTVGRIDDANKLWGPVSRNLDRQITEKTAALTIGSPNPALLADRGTLYARLGEFRQAADDFAKAIDLAPENHRYWHDGLMPLLLQLGDVNGFRRKLTDELQRFKATSDGPTAHRVAKDAFMIPLDGEEMRIAVELADRALGKVYDSWGFQTKGMAQYRSGHYRQAIDWLSKARKAAGDASFQTTDDLFQAMSYEGAGDHQQASATLRRTVHRMDTEFPNAREGDLGSLPGGFPDWILRQVVRREAEELINGKGPTTKPVASTQPAN